MKRRWTSLLLAAALTTTLAGCGAGTDSTASTGGGEEQKSIELGYAVSTMAHEWYANIAKGAERRAEELGVDLTIADAAMDAGKQASYIENFVTQGVDVIAITPVDPTSLKAPVLQAKDAGIPLLAESSAFDGMDTLLGIPDYDAAYSIGEWMGQNAAEDLKVLIVGQPIYEACRLRVDGFKAGLEASGVNYEIVQEVDGNGTKEDSLAVSSDALTAHPDINVIFGINDNSATGGMNAYKEHGLDESRLTVLGFGFEGVVGREALLSGGPYKAAVAMFPEYMGAKIVDAAIDAVDGELQEQYTIPTVVITQDNFDQFYTQTADGEYETNFEAIDALLAEQGQ